MSNSQFERKLAAILYADVAGYSRLTGEDEEGTHLQLRESLDKFSNTIAEHGGRVVHYAGDAILADFPAVTDALKCAVSYQEKIRKADTDLPEDRRVQFRIGVNLGEVIVDRDDIYGDGVNVAARLESLAEPGGICVSEAVRSAVGTNLTLNYADMGEQQVKNIREPVRVFRVRLGPQSLGKARVETHRTLARWRIASAASAGMAVLVVGYMAWRIQVVPQEPADFCQRKSEFELPDRPSVAVMPFDTLSPDTTQQYLGELVSESIITTLAKVPDLFVIAHSSTAIYKEKPVKSQAVADELGVRYVLEGSVRQDGGRMRISAQLVDSKTGDHIWAERYDRQSQSSVEVMDDISFEILNALEVELTEGEQARIRGLGTDNLAAYQLYRQAMKEQLRLSPEGNANASELAKRAIELDPYFWGGWVALGYASSSKYWFGPADKSESFRLGTAYAQRALEVGGESNPDAYLLLSFIENWRGNHQESIVLARKALALSPSMADAWGQLGITLNSAGRPDEAIPVIENAMRLSPYHATYILLQLAKAYRLTGRHEEAILANRELICRSPDQMFAYRDLALSYGALGQDVEAREAVAQLLKIQPDYSLQDYVSEGDSGVGPELRASNTKILRRAGLPE